MNNTLRVLNLEYSQIKNHLITQSTIYNNTNIVIYNNL